MSTTTRSRTEKNRTELDRDPGREGLGAGFAPGQGRQAPPRRHGPVGVATPPSVVGAPHRVAGRRANPCSTRSTGSETAAISPAYPTRQPRRHIDLPPRASTRARSSTPSTAGQRRCCPQAPRCAELPRQRQDRHRSALRALPQGRSSHVCGRPGLAHLSAPRPATAATDGPPTVSVTAGCSYFG